MVDTHLFLCHYYVLTYTLDVPLLQQIVLACLLCCYHQGYYCTVIALSNIYFLVHLLLLQCCHSRQHPSHPRLSLHHPKSILLTISLLIHHFCHSKMPRQYRVLPLHNVVVFLLLLLLCTCYNSFPRCHPNQKHELLHPALEPAVNIDPSQKRQKLLYNCNLVEAIICFFIYLSNTVSPPPPTLFTSATILAKLGGKRFYIGQCDRNSISIDILSYCIVYI